MYSQPEAWSRLMKKLGDMAAVYVKAQIRAGAKAIQVFDSWVGALSADDYRRYIKPTMDALFKELKKKAFR